MIAVDWSHTKELTTYDGKKVRVESLKKLISRISKSDGESKVTVESITALQPSDEKIGLGEESRLPINSELLSHSPSLVLESGCPMSIIYQLILAGASVSTIDNHATENYRKSHGIEKTDENDAMIIYKLANNGIKPFPVSLDNKLLQLHDLYGQYCRYQKARIAMTLMRKAHERQYRGLGESKLRLVQSTYQIYPKPLDLMPYDIAIDTLEGREKSLMKRIEETARGLPLFEAGDESTSKLISTKGFQSPPRIKGLGQRLWIGIMIKANPTNFKCVSAYLRYCGLTDSVKEHKYSRHARMLYHLLAEEVMKQRDIKFRPIFDKCKQDIAEKHPDYTKGHINNAALNRTATFLAKEIFNHVRDKTV